MLDSILLFLLLKHPPKLGDQRGCNPYVLLLDHPQQIFRIHIAMGSRLIQIFQSLFPVSTDAISEIVDLTKLVFRIGLTTSGVEIGLSCSSWLYIIIYVPIYQDGIMHKYMGTYSLNIIYGRI